MGEGVADMTGISGITEEIINENLKNRYNKDEVYTYIGSIMVAVNPYKELDIYELDNVRTYQGRKLGDLDPHIFAIAEAAYTGLKREQKSQSCVISGESGAGKTETTKLILQYLCAATSNTTRWVEQQILEANTVLEAFGNSRTVRNDNSSRFGKFIQVSFNEEDQICGCELQDYLLEKSRITFQSNNERNYHVFYQLVSGAMSNADLREELMMETASKYFYLNQSGCYTLAGVDDSQMFDDLRLAMNVLNISSEMSLSIFKVLSAILWLGNLEFTDIDGETSQLTDADLDIAEKIAQLLGIAIESVLHLLTFRQLVIRGHTTEIPLKFHEAGENKHAMAKSLYSSTFTWLTSQINLCTNPGSQCVTFIGVLDIFGFENFSVNSFEQLCINYANEKLHKFFNHYLFAIEQDLYKEEEIDYAHINFIDNSECLELIEKPPKCVLRMIGEECRFPKGTDITYITKQHNELHEHQYYIRGDDRRRWNIEFGIKHYAGPVNYTISGFLQKNKDVPQDLMYSYLANSKNLFGEELSNIQRVLSVSELTDGTQSMMGTMSRAAKGKPTIGDTFRRQLNSLVETLDKTTPWYIRCVKPNGLKKAGEYDDELTLMQLRYSGMLDIIRIKQQGFPVHIPASTFLDKYKMLFANKIQDTRDDIANVEAILSSMDIPKTEWQIGKTKVFLRVTVSEPLEEQKRFMLHRKAIHIQKHWKGFVCKKWYRQQKTAAIVIQTYFRGRRQRLHFRRVQRAVVKIQATVRMMFARDLAAEIRRQKMEEEKKRLQLQREKEEEEQRLREKAEFDLKKQAEFDLKKQTEFDLKKQAEFDLKKQAEFDLKKQTEAALKKKAETVISDNQKELSILARYADAKTKQLASPALPNSPDTLDLDQMFSFLTDDSLNMKSNDPNSVLSAISTELDNMLSEISGMEEDLELEDTDKKRRKLQLSKIINEIEIEEDIQNDLDLPLPAPPVLENIEYDEDKTFPLPPPPEDLIVGDDEDRPRIDSFKEEEEASMIEPPPPPLPDRTSLIIREEDMPNYPAPLTPPMERQSVKFNLPEPPAIATLKRNELRESERKKRRQKRVERQLKSLFEPNLPADLSTSMQQNPAEELKSFNISDFAEKYFQSHVIIPQVSGGLGGTLRTLGRKKTERHSSVLAKADMVVYTKSSTIETSLLHLKEHENISIACHIFKDIQKFLHDQTMKSDNVTNLIQNIINHGIDKTELRDEIFCQLIRQTNHNPSVNGLLNGWGLLTLCCISFPPSKTLNKYLQNYLQESAKDIDIAEFANSCLKYVRMTRVNYRKHAPSSDEIECVMNQQQMICRFHFLDGTVKAVNISPINTAGEVVKILAKKIGLQSTDGWAMFQQLNDGEHFIRQYEYMADILSSWDELRKVSKSTSIYATLSKKSQTMRGHHLSPAADNKFLFSKRVFKNINEIPQDPVEYHLIYAQAVHSVVKLDEFPVSDKVALQLAGLQAQVLLGDYEDNRKERYNDVLLFLNHRIANSDSDRDWSLEIEDAHRKYGHGKSEIQAKVWYLTFVKQYPLYGSTFFPVTYKGFWSHPTKLLLAINNEGVKYLTDNKDEIRSYNYARIEKINIDGIENEVQVKLKPGVSGEQRLFVFETKQKEDVATLIACYASYLSHWQTSDGDIKPKKILSEDYKAKLRQDVISVRHDLAEKSQYLNSPIDAGGVKISTMSRKTVKKAEKAQNRISGTFQQIYYQDVYWSFSKSKQLQTLTVIDDERYQDIAIKMFTCLQIFAGVSTSGGIDGVDSSDKCAIMQALIEKCLENEALRNEFYMQLIKQTTAHPDAKSKVNIRNWQAMSLVTSSILPPNKIIQKYLQAHLRYYSAEDTSDQCKYAQFCLKVLGRNLEKKTVRTQPPSIQEFNCTFNRQPIYTRFYFMDGQYRAIEFDSMNNVSEVLTLVRNKIGLKKSTKGYALYEVFGFIERIMQPNEIVADAMYKWEKYGKSIQSKNELKLTFKKRLFLNAHIVPTDPVEFDLLFHQALSSIASDNLSVAYNEAVNICGMRAHVKFGDYQQKHDVDYGPVVEECLPKSMSSQISISDICSEHQKHTGKKTIEVNQECFQLISKSPMYGCTFFEVTQTYTYTLPKTLWLAVNEMGVHLLQPKGKEFLASYAYRKIVSYSPSLKSLLIVTEHMQKGKKFVFQTSQAQQIANLIKDYTLTIAEVQIVTPTIPQSVLQMLSSV